MSDYGDYSDDDFLDFDFLDDYTYVEDGYHVADDLAERTVASPPPYDDGDDYIDWDRFNYWDDIEDGSVGYFDCERRRRNHQKGEVTGQKRSRLNLDQHTKKRLKTSREDSCLSPTPTVKWRSQASRSERPIPHLEPNTQRPVALLKDWKERFGNGTPRAETRKTKVETLDENIVTVSAPLSPSREPAEGAMEIDEDALKAALASRLGEIGGGMEGLDPQMLLQYAMRMLGGEEDADEIAGELAEDLLDRDEDDPSAEGISSFLSRQRQATQGEADALTPAESSVEEVPDTAQRTPLDSKHILGSRQPPTPSSSDTSNIARSLAEAESPVTPSTHDQKRKTQPHNTRNTTEVGSRKRKAGPSEPEDGDGEANAPRPKRAQRSFDAPTASSKARTTRTSEKSKSRKR